MLIALDGDTGAGVRLLEAALAESGPDVELRTTVTRKLADVYGMQGRLPESLHLQRLALGYAEASGDLVGETDALLGIAQAAVLMGDDLPVGLLDRVEKLVRIAGPRAPHEDPELVLAFVDTMRGDARTAADRLERLYRQALEHGDELGSAWAGGLLVTADVLTGRWQRAQRLAHDSMLAVRRAGNPPAGRVPALLAVAFVDAHLGEVDRAREYATAAVEVAERAGVPFAVIEARTILGFAALSEGDAPGAHDHLAAALRHRRELGFHEPVWAHLAWSELDALVELGDLDPAEALARGLRERGQRFGHPYPLATAARGHALVLATRGDLGGARAELDRALTEHDRLGWPFERARTLLTLGVVLRRDKQKRAARETLHQALAIFEDLGARLWAAKVTAELARIGGWPAATGSLTVTERRVARLVADGHTNREVADLLFLSTKTVAAHLTSIYAKVGVRSRTELSRYLSPDDPDT